MSLQYVNKAGICEDLCNRVCRYYSSNKANIDSTAAKFYSGNDFCLKYKSDLMKLAVVIKAFEYTHNDYVAKGIPDDIFFDTLSDVGIWCEENDNKGLKNYLWLKNHVRFSLFKLGRLQFQFYPCVNFTLNYSELPFSFGDNLLFIDIPRAGKLDYEKCRESLEFARRFFSNYFPEFKYEYFFCESWLLFGDNNRFMSESSNILRFSDLFEYGYSNNNESQAFDRIFGVSKPLCSKSKISALPNNTSLQKNAIEYKLAGGKFGQGVCWIKK